MDTMDTQQEPHSWHAAMQPGRGFAQGTWGLSLSALGQAGPECPGGACL